MESPNSQEQAVNETKAHAAEEVVQDKPWLSHYPKEVPAALQYPKVNIVQFLIETAKSYPGHKAVYFMGKVYTYEQIYKLADQLARQMCRMGIHPGDRVAIMLPNCPQAVIAYYAVLLAGAVVVQTNPLYMERELKYQLKDCGATAIISLDLLYPKIESVRGKNPEEGPLSTLKHVIITSISDGLPFPKNKLYTLKQKKDGKLPKVPYEQAGIVAWRTLMKKSALSAERPPLPNSDELAAIQYTGGTTGTPKGVMLSHSNLVANTVQISAWCYQIKSGEEKFLASLPLFHVFGLTVLMNYAVKKANCLYLLPKFEVNEVLRMIAKHKPTIFPGAPTMYVALIKAAKDMPQLDLSSIKVCISGSAALPLEVQDQFESMTGGRLIEGYGLSEASPVTHVNPIWDRRKIGTIGLPLPDTEAVIIHPETGEPLPQGELGELVVKGPQVMQGYWNKPDATEEVLKDGWLKTGDLAYIDKEGYFVIMDRIKDMIIAGGYNIYPREIEEVLFEHPAILEASVVGIKDAYRGETVKAFIVLRENWNVTDKQLDGWCRERLAAYKVPHSYAFRDSLPKTMIGKVLRRQLAEEEQQNGAK